MNYIVIGLLLAIGWHSVKLVFDNISELIFERLHKTNWYLVAARHESSTEDERPGDIKSVKNHIGFV